jgi:hypothetical protein
MRELQERIFRETSAAAAEITAADIPPLQLTGFEGRPAGRRGVLGRPARPGHGEPGGVPIRRILAPVAAAASVIALAAVIVVAGQGSSGAPHPASIPARNSHGHSRADQQPAAEALNWYFPASGASYTEGLAFAWLREKITAHDIDPCLAAAGYPQPAFRGSVQLYQLSFPDNSQFPDLAQLAAYPGQYHFTAQYPVVRNPISARVQAFDHARALCTAQYARAVTRVDQAAGSLRTAWAIIVGHIQNSRAVRATQPAFARCLEAHGVPASLATETSNAQNPLFAGYFAWADSKSQSAAGNAQLAADQRQENRVFVACARPVLAVLEPIQLARRAQFFDQHRAQITRIARLAQEMGS